MYFVAYCCNLKIKFYITISDHSIFYHYFVTNYDGSYLKTLKPNILHSHKQTYFVVIHDSENFLVSSRTFRRTTKSADLETNRFLKLIETPFSSLPAAKGALSFWLALSQTFFEHVTGRFHHSWVNTVLYSLFTNIYAILRQFFTIYTILRQFPTVYDSLLQFSPISYSAWCNKHISCPSIKAHDLLYPLIHTQHP